MSLLTILHKPLKFTLLPVLTVLLLASCAKNEFSLEGKIEGGDSGTLYLHWRAASASRDFMAMQGVPLTSSAFKVSGPVKRPSVIWVFSAGRQLLTTIYMERGDKLTLSGEMKTPGLWQVKGNKVMEQVSEWELSHREAIAGGRPEAVNRAVAEYVKAHPATRTALFLLFTRYDRREATPAEYDRLLTLCSTDKELLAEMRFACLEPADVAAVTMPADRSARIRQVLSADTLKKEAGMPISAPEDVDTPQVNSRTYKEIKIHSDMQMGM